MTTQDQISIIVEEETVVVQITAMWTVKISGKERNVKEAHSCLEIKGGYIVYIVSF